jgi:hypothetical protein
MILDYIRSNQFAANGSSPNAVIGDHPEVAKAIEFWFPAVAAMTIKMI